MFSVKRITSIEYYEAQDKAAGEDATLAPHSAGRDAVAYYTDNGQGESSGVWWTRTGKNDPAQPQSLPLLPSSIFGKDGERVKGRHLRDLAAGRHPETKKPLTKASANGKRSVGFDVTISAPKSLSSIAAASDPETRGRLFDAHDRAARRMMNQAFDNGLIVAHRAVRDPLTGKKSYFEEPVAETSAAVYRHFTSRAQDPQLHSHIVLMNVAVREDGTTGAIDNRRFKLYGGALAAIYRAELASILREEFGLETVRKGRNFEVAGIPEAVIETFSKRKAEVEAAMDGKATAGNRAAAQIAAYETRDAKDKTTSLTELEQRWDRELAALGWNRNTLWQSATSAAREMRREAAGKDREAEIEKALRSAIEEMVRNNSVIDDRLLMRDAVEALQTMCSADEALAAIERMRSAGFLLQIGEKDDRPVYSTAEIVEAERAMLRTARDRRGERDFADAASIERAIAARPTMREDQKAAVRHALNRDGVSVVEGFAGSGKSFSLGTVAEVARAVGMEVYTIAPSHKAKEVVRADTKTAEEFAKAVQGFVNRIGKDPAKGGIVLKRDTVVIVDEAGMVGTDDMAKLVEATAAAGCKLVLTGDTRQLQPVVAGAPMKAIARLCGSSQMTEVTRQRMAWQRAASQDFARGNAVPALEAYDRAGSVVVGDDREATIAKLVSDYAESRRAPQEGDRPKTRAILASWNVDVRAINAEVRKAGKAAGWIEDPDWTMTVIPRGGDEPQKLGFAVGEDIIFGETVEDVKGHTLYNADIARIAGISGSPDDPTLRLVLAKGPEIEVRLSELVGRREEGDPAVPRFQHAAAMTVHASQGVTVDECYVANLRGMGQESTYVAMTRHRDSVKLYADGGRIVDEIAAQAGSAIKQTASGETTLPEEEDKKEAEITAQEIKTRLFKEAEKADLKENASDYSDLATFLDGPQPASVAETVPPVVDTAAEVRKALDATPAPVATNVLPPTLPRGPHAAAMIFKRMQERAAAGVRYPVPQAPKPSPRNDARPPAEPRISESERAEMARTNLVTFALEKLGAVQTAADQRASSRDGSYAKVRFGDETVSITQRNGNWLWTKTNDRSVSGLIWDMVAWQNGGSKIDAMRWLRHELKTFVEKPLNFVRPAPVSKAEAQDRNDAANARVNWMKYPAGPSLYLTRERGIRPETLALLAADVKSDFTGDRASNRYGAVFAHRTPDGELASYCRRGGPQKGEEKSFRSFAKGVSPVLFMAGEKAQPKTIYVTESAIDTISLFQHDRTPEGAMLVAPDGTPGRRSLEAIEELARRHPDAVWHVGLDNDAAGAEFDSQVKAAIRKGNEKAWIEARTPSPEFKDWNGAVRGATREQEQEAREKRRQEAEAEARRVAEREERQRREREEEHRHTMRGPRM